MAPPKDIARSYPKRGLTADVGFRSEPKFCGDGSAEFATGIDGTGTYTNTLGDTLSMCCWVWNDAVANAYFMDLGTNSSKAQISISYHNGTGAGINSRPYIWNGSAVIIATEEMAAKEWHHLAVTAAPGAGNIKIYLDGMDVTPSHSTDVNITTNAILLGKWVGAASGNFNGKMANAALFRTTLTQDQVRECMRASSFSQFDAISTLEAFYPLDANFNDSTSGGHDLTVTGSPSFTVDRPQLPRGLDLARGAAQARVYSGRAVDFDGSADRLRAAHYNPSGDFLTTTGWVNADTLRNQGVIYNGSTGRNSFLFYMLSTGGLRFYWNDTTGDAAIDHQTTLTTGRWYHLAAVMDMSDPADHQVTFYIDGIAATGTRIASGFTGDNNYGFGNEYGTAGWFDGKIADCRIYDVALTQAQVRELYHNPEQVLPTGISASNLRRYYPLSDYNDATAGGMGGRYFQDMGADGEPAEDQGSCTMAFAQPVPCPQLGLQQSATRHFFTGASSQSWRATVTAPGTTATLSGWMFWGDSSRTSYLAAIGQVTDAADSFNIRINAGFGDVTMYKASEIDSGLNVNEGEWNHIVVTTKSTSPYWRCWVNGVEASSPAVAPVTNITTGFVYPGSNSTPFPLNGFINDVAFWDAELDTSDVAALYNSGVQGMDVSTVQSANLKGWWKADDLTTFKDYSGNGADAIAFGGVGTIIGASFPENANGSTIVGDFSMKRKGASILNINNDQGYAYALGQDKPSYFPKAGATGYTMSVAHRPIKTGITEIFWGNDITVGTTPPNDQFILFMNPNGSYQWQLGDGSSRPPAVSAVGVADGEWHIITLTIDYSVSPARWTIYADGIQSTTGTASISGPPGNFYDVSFGRWLSGGYKGSSASGCYRFYDVALSADEVKRLAFSDLRLIKGLANE